jgi:hypothetical protein
VPQRTTQSRAPLIKCVGVKMKLVFCLMKHHTQFHVATALPPRKECLVPVHQEAGCVLEPMWMFWRRPKLRLCREQNQSRPARTQSLHTFSCSSQSCCRLQDMQHEAEKQECMQSVNRELSHKGADVISVICPLRITHDLTSPPLPKNMKCKRGVSGTGLCYCEGADKSLAL